MENLAVEILFVLIDPSAKCTAQNKTIFGFTASKGSANSLTVHYSPEDNYELRQSKSYVLSCFLIKFIAALQFVSV